MGERRPPRTRLNSPAPRVPSLVRGQLALRPGKDPRVGTDHIDRTVSGTLIASVAELVDSRIARDAARKNRMGLGLELELFRNQLPEEHPLRRRTGWLGTGLAKTGVVRLGSDSRAKLLELVDEALDCQRAHDPAYYTAGGHHTFDHPVGDERDAELQFVAATIARFAQLGWGNPPSGEPDGPRRGLYGSVVVDAAGLNAAAITTLADAYNALALDGYSLSIINFRQSDEQARLILALATALQATGRPCLVSGLGSWRAALLGHGLAAVVGGVRGGIQVIDPGEQATDLGDGRHRYRYYGRILGHFGMDAKGDAEAAAIFDEHPCPCGFHQPRVVPVRSEIGHHNRWWHAEDAAVSLGRSPGVDWRQRVDAARATRKAANMNPLKACWNVLPVDQVDLRLAA